MRLALLAHYGSASVGFQGIGGRIDKFFIFATLFQRLAGWPPFESARRRGEESPNTLGASLEKDSR